MVIEPLVINGKKVVTIKQFAAVTNRSTESVRQLISKGNRIRKIKVVHFGDKPYIPFSEIENYPFTVSGRSSKTVYKFFLNESQSEYIPEVVEG